MIYLASQSARRKEILRKLKIRFTVVRSTYQERNPRGIRPGQLTVLHAAGKIKKAKLPKQARYVMGCDTVVYLKGQVLGKPRSLQHARQMLRMLSGRKHAVYSGLVLHDRKRMQVLKGVEKTEVYFKKLTRLEIERYIRVIHPLDKAGGYAIQVGPKVVRKIKGSYTNVVGLPVELLIRMMKKMK